MIERYLRFEPVVDPTAFVHEMAYLCGDVEVAARSSIWPTAVLRGDQGAIRIGIASNIQDGTVIHATGDLSTSVIGARVTVGHRAVVHGCVVGDDCLIGMGAIVMDNAVIGSGSIVGAGALVLANTVIPPNSMVLGAPAHAVRGTTRAHHESIEHSWKTYVRLAREYSGRCTSEDLP